MGLCRFCKGRRGFLERYEGKFIRISGKSMGAELEAGVDHPSAVTPFFGNKIGCDRSSDVDHDAIVDRKVRKRSIRVSDAVMAELFGFIDIQVQFEFGVVEKYRVDLLLLKSCLHTFFSFGI